MGMTLNILFFMLLELTFAKPGKCFLFSVEKKHGLLLGSGAGEQLKLLGL